MKIPKNKLPKKCRKSSSGELGTKGMEKYRYHIFVSKSTYLWLKSHGIVMEGFIINLPL